MLPNPREMWERGYLLSVAVGEWCDPEDREIYDRPLPDNDRPYKPEDGLLQAIAGVSSWYLATRECERKKAEALERMREEILLQLFNEALLAYGFAIGKNDRSPRLISPEFWDNAEVDWGKEIADNGNSKFNRLRIIEPSEYPELELQPKIGRSTNKEEIYSACKALSKRDEDFSQLPNKKKIQQVRDHIKSEHPEIDVDGPGMGDDAIRKRIKEFKDKNVKR